MLLIHFFTKLKIKSYRSENNGIEWVQKLYIKSTTKDKNTEVISEAQRSKPFDSYIYLILGFKQALNDQKN